jgi:tetratricopeptide (TPR) repeat protein
MKACWLLLVAFILASLCPPRINAEDAAAEIQRHEQQARLALGRNDLQQAVKEYQTIVKLDPKNAAVYTALGVALYGSGRPTEAAAAFQAALRLDAGQTQAEVFLGLSDADTGHCPEATPLLAKHFSAQTELKLRRLVGLSLLGCYAASSEFDSAQNVAAGLRQTYPGDPDVLYNLAELYTRLWDNVAAELMEKHPESFRVHQLGGEVMEAQGRTDRAIKEYQLAVKENPRVPQLNYRIGRLILRAGGPDADQQALGKFQQELAVNSSDAPSEYWIGVIYTNQHKGKEAEEHFQRSKKLDPAFADPYVGLAKVLLQEKQPQKAMSELQKAIQIEPNDATAHYELMEAYRDQGKLAEAQQEMAVFQKLQKSDSESFRSRLDSLLSGQSKNEKNAD